MLGETARTADREVLRKEFNLDRPLMEQYLLFLQGALRGDLGRSIHTRRPVVEMVAERFPATLELALGAMVVAVFLAIPLGVVSAVKKDTAVDSGSRFFAMLGIAMPNFWLGPLLIIFFSLQLGWLPVAGRGGAASLVLPAVTLGTAMCAILTRMTRSSMVEVLGEDFVSTARAKGLREITVLVKHAFRNGLIPIITLMGLQMGGLLAGSIITETVFSWPGIGTLLISAINSRDFPVLQGCVAFISVSYILINLATDLVYAAADPRLRLGSKD
jgi:peptide/nickel transport system permease protein